jgi:hypothetical protein
MVRERLDGFWIRCLYTVFANEPGMSDKAVADRMKELADTLDRSDYPATRTVNKYHDQYHRLTEPVKAGYKDFGWPESMEAGLLPWEASAAALELLAIRRDIDRFAHYRQAAREGPLTALDLPLGRPSLRLTRWFWRVTQAAPDLPGQSMDVKWPQELEETPPLPAPNWPGRYEVARSLSVGEAVANVGGTGTQRMRAGVEAYLAYAPWHSGLRSGAYLSAIASGDIPRLDPTALDLFEDCPAKPYPIEVIGELFGTPFAEHLGRKLHLHTSQQQANQEQEDING